MSSVPIVSNKTKRHSLEDDKDLSEKSSFLVGDISDNVKEGLKDVVIDSNLNVTISKKSSVCSSKGTKVKTVRGWRRFIGFMLGFIHIVAVAAGSLVAKILINFHPFSLTAFRFQGILVPSILILAYTLYTDNKKPKEEREKILNSIWPLTDPTNLKVVILFCIRAFTGCSGITLFFYSLRYIQLGDAAVIQAAAPVFVNFFAYILLKESFGIFQIFLAILSIIGVGVISRPPILTGADSFDLDILIGCGFAIACMFFSVISILILRYLNKLHYTFSLLSFGAIGTIQSLICALVIQVFHFPETLHDTILIILLAVITFIAQTSLIQALKYEEAGPIAIFRSLSCIVAFALQKIFLGVTGDIYSILGMILVIIAASLTVTRKYLLSLPEKHKIRKTFFFMIK